MENNRIHLERRDGERFRCTATVARFGSMRGWNGVNVPTILLEDVRDARTNETLTDHLWFQTGVWSSRLRPGDRFAFDGRVSAYVKGYQGRRNVPEAPVTRDWRLARPTKVEVISRASTPGPVRRPDQERGRANATAVRQMRVGPDAADEPRGAGGAVGVAVPRV